MRRMLLTVHDELVLEVPESRARRRPRSWCATSMESVTELRVPLVVDIGFGPNWADGEVALRARHALPW